MDACARWPTAERVFWGAKERLFHGRQDRGGEVVRTDGRAYEIMQGMLQRMSACVRARNVTYACMGGNGRFGHENMGRVEVNDALLGQIVWQRRVRNGRRGRTLTDGVICFTDSSWTFLRRIVTSTAVPSRAM